MGSFLEKSFATGRPPTPAPRPCCTPCSPRRDPATRRLQVARLLVEQLQARPRSLAVNGERRGRTMTASAKPAARPPWVGQSRRRTEDPRLLRGRGRYIDDLEPLRGIVHAAILRSPHAHARIVSIDPAAARQAPGVLGVLTGE